MIYSGQIINFIIQLLKEKHLIRNTENLDYIMKLLSLPVQDCKHLLCLRVSEMNYYILVFYNI